MLKMHSTVVSNVSQEEAIKRIKNLIADLKQQYENEFTVNKEEWQDNVFTCDLVIRSYELSGRLAVLDNSVEIEGNFKYQALPFRKRAEQVIRERLSKLLEGSNKDDREEVVIEDKAP